MSTIQKFTRAKGDVYRVLIRKAGSKPISKTFSNKKLAIQFAKSMDSNREFFEAYGYENNKEIKLSLLINNYLNYEYKGKDKVEQSRKLRIWLKYLGDIRIKEIKSSAISHSLSTLPSYLSNASINRHKAAISGALTYALRKGYIKTNPARIIPSLPENNERTRFLSEAERTRLFSSCRASHWDKLYLIVLLAITTGARKGELTKLGWGDIDFERRTAYVSTTKNGQAKVLPLTESVIKELQLFNKNDSRLIFESKVKDNVAYCFTKPWKKALEDAEIKDFRFHDLRHSCASYLAQSGASLLEIADVLGHKQISVTKRYAHLCIEHKSSLINRVMSSI
ncbi:site-specific integrase [Candidatus Pseudothioglobus singularis]|nr:site-specific integrase [Candidatus Pseudothioglobus singularis]MDB4598965.1 site-specific integrase [Candidatus Pseudothioglobus singularis]